nr:putative mature peptide toxin-like GVDKE [Pelinobius muticus]
MKTSMLAVFVALPLAFVLTAATEERAHPNELVNSLAELVKLDAERGVDKEGCKYMFGSCGKSDDCCPKLACKRTFNYCAWDGSV